MIIQKDYKFYAAHRNEELQDKCRNLHGHRYGIRCHFQVERRGSISTLFGDFDDCIEPWIKEQYDHALLIHVNDPLYTTLIDHCRRTGDMLRMKCLPGATSVENLAYMLFTEISEMGFTLVRLEVRETDTSVLIYTYEDWEADKRRNSSTGKSRAGGIRVSDSNNADESTRLADGWYPCPSVPPAMPTEHGSPAQ